MRFSVAVLAHLGQKVCALCMWCPDTFCRAVAVLTQFVPRWLVFRWSHTVILVFVPGTQGLLLLLAVLVHGWLCWAGECTLVSGVPDCRSHGPQAGEIGDRTHSLGFACGERFWPLNLPGSLYVLK